MINWMKYRIAYFVVSVSMILLGIFGLTLWKLNLGVDFTGGTIIEYSFDKPISTEEVTKNLSEKEIPISAIQAVGENRYLFRMPPISTEEKSSLNTSLDEIFTDNSYNELRFETVGPAIGSELIKKTIYAAIVAATAILLWVAIQFKSVKFGTTAILAMFHDTFILIGSFSVFGHLWQAEVDFLFVTALLTTLSFSVHDTIVVYDRIRESQRKLGGSLREIANKAITETMVRSLNNSFTIIFMLLALLLLGGSSVRWFATALLVGTVLGTYSSPFVAVPLLVTWDELLEKLKKKK